MTYYTNGLKFNSPFSLGSTIKAELLDQKGVFEQGKNKTFSFSIQIYDFFITKKLYKNLSVKSAYEELQKELLNGICNLIPASAKHLFKINNIEGYYETFGYLSEIGELILQEIWVNYFNNKINQINNLLEIVDSNELINTFTEEQVNIIKESLEFKLKDLEETQSGEYDF